MNTYKSIQSNTKNNSLVHVINSIGDIDNI